MQNDVDEENGDEMDPPAFLKARLKSKGS